LYWRWACNRLVFKEDNEVLRGVKGKVIDAHAKVIDDKMHLVCCVAWQPQGNQPLRCVELLGRLGEHPTHEVVHMAVSH